MTLIELWRRDKDSVNNRRHKEFHPSLLILMVMYCVLNSKPVANDTIVLYFWNINTRTQDETTFLYFWNINTRTQDETTFLYFWNVNTRTRDETTFLYFWNVNTRTRDGESLPARSLLSPPVAHHTES